MPPQLGHRAALCGRLWPQMRHTKIRATGRRTASTGGGLTGGLIFCDVSGLVGIVSVGGFHTSFCIPVAGACDPLGGLRGPRGRIKNPAPFTGVKRGPGVAGRSADSDVAGGVAPGSGVTAPPVSNPVVSEIFALFGVPSAPVGSCGWPSSPTICWSSPVS